MLNMQSFHQWLSSQITTPDARHERLSRLTQARRDQIMAASSELDWYVWSEAAAAKPAQ